MDYKKLVLILFILLINNFIYSQNIQPDPVLSPGAISININRGTYLRLTTAIVRVTLPDSCWRIIDWGVVRNQAGNNFYVDIKTDKIDAICAMVIRTEIKEYEIGILPSDIYSFSVYNNGEYLKTVQFQIEDEVQTPIPTVEPTPDIRICGDYNNDGYVNIIDSVIIAQDYIKEFWHISNKEYRGIFEQGDVNNDNRLNIVDALLIALYQVGLIDELNCNF